MHLAGIAGGERALSTCSTCGEVIRDFGMTGLGETLLPSDGELAPFCPHCGAHADAVPPVLVDGRYQVHSELGRGGMGVVYLATDLGLQRSVALKMISPKYADDPEWVSGFHKEAVALASIRNPHVVQIYAFGGHEQAYFFAMEYVRGRNLRRILSEHRSHGEAVPVHRALTILAQLGEGLDAVHATGLVHRDVKPENIVIEEDTGRPVLVDFGLAVPSATTTEMFEGGTPDYMAPEQTWFAPFGSVITPRTDVYALGCVAFEMLTGRVVFEGDDQRAVVRAHVEKPARPASSVRVNLAPFDEAFERALAKSPQDRYASCPDLVRALAAAGDAWQRNEKAITELPPPPPPASSALLDAYRVLVVDDDPSFRRFATRAVQLAFYGAMPRITAVDSGAAAIASAARNPPDLVLLDFDMPELDGVDTLSRLRALPGGERARVVMMSGNAGGSDRWRFSILGVNDFVDKPVDLEQLVQAISAIAVRAGWREDELGASVLG